MTVRTVEQTASTNADMLAAAQAGTAEGVRLRAVRQTAGRGRRGRTWVSPPGNLYASTLVRLRPTDPPAHTLALVAAVAVEAAVSAWLGQGEAGGAAGGSGSRSVGLQLKWPNDLLLGGAKLAGILLERGGDVVVVGAGINLAHHPDPPDRVTTSLAVQGVEVDPQVMAESLAHAFADWLDRWRGEGVSAVRSRWLERAHPSGTALTVRLPDGSEAHGEFDGLDAEGALILRLAAGGRRVIHAGDVFLP